MRRKIFSIWSVLLILVLALAVFVPGCEGEIPLGTIEVKATLDGSPWTGDVDYTLTPATGSGFAGTSVDDTFIKSPGDWTCAYISGGPAGANFVDITPAATQNLVAEGTITFTLNFVTPATPIDAEVYFQSWTINGAPVVPGWYFVSPGDWVDVEYTEHVSGEEDAHVNVHQTSWLEVHNIGWYGEEPGGPTVNLHVVNAPGAVKMDPPAADKSNQQATVNGNPVDACSTVPLPWCEKVKLDVEVDWELVVCNNYTKTINWIGFNPPGSMPLFAGPDVLFESMDDFYNGVTFNLTAKACVAPGEGFEDTDSANDCTDWAPTLTVTFLLPL
jgi:hypothetical protein